VNVNWNAELAGIAREHLPPDIAERWIALLRPAFALGRDVDGPVVGQLGGLPHLPDDLAWPVWRKWNAEGPVAYIAGIDCAAVPAGHLDIPLPAAGTLHFFADEKSYADKEYESGTPYRGAAARLLYVPPGSAVRERPAPAVPPAWPNDDQVVAYEPFPLRARPIGTAPDDFSATLRAAFWRPGPDYEFRDRDYPSWVFERPWDHPVRGAAFGEAVFEVRERNPHQLGGYACAVQWPIENQLWPRPDYPFRPGDESGPVHPAPGTLLAQFSEDDNIGSWGDFGKMYWAILPADLAARHFASAVFDLQVG
jgi:uncharacterized protein DUF1963